jgi:glycosyltransferase involved in cell wall biosynthesis
MKLLVLSRYGRLGASSRLRLYQYLPYLNANGIETTVVPLSSDEYLERLYAGRRPPGWWILGEYLRRLCALPEAFRHDLIWLEKEIFPGAPALVERAMARLGVRYVADYDDATFHKYDRSDNPLFRRVWPRKIDAVMRHAVTVTAGNEYLASRARAAGARRVEVVPTVVDVSRYRVSPRPGSRFAVGWVGTPVTQRYLEPVGAPLAAATQGREADLILIGAAPGWNGAGGVTPQIRPWSESREAADIADFEVGIMPLADSDWERGKCGYKLIQYMASGKPVVASPVGVNVEIVEHGVNGFLASSPEEWRQALERLRDDPDLRYRMGLAGRRKVEASYSLEAMAPRVLAILRDAARRPAT